MTDSPPLTKRQHDLLECIETLRDENGYSPSYREIAKAMGLRSVSTIAKHVKILKAKGVLRGKGRRALEKGGLQAELPLPFVGQITGGEPLQLFSKPDKLPVPASLVSNPEKTYLLQVEGDKLLSEALMDGDLLIVEPRGYADDGETIVGSLSGRGIIVGRFCWEEEIQIESADSSIPRKTIAEGDLTIHGVILSVLRIM